MTEPFDLSGPTLKTNLHTHTTHSDGAFSVTDVVAAYEALDYDVLAITDHNRWQDHGQASTDKLLVLSSNEPSLSHGEHALATGIHGPSPVDTGERPRERMQEVIDWVNEQGGLSTVNHPTWTGMSVQRLLELQRFASIEICNAGCIGHGSEYSVTHWDELLRRGRRVWGLATDDSHSDWDRGLGWVEVYAARQEEAVVTALKSGRFFASTGPRFEHIGWDGERLLVETEPVQGIALMSDIGPVAVAHGGNGTVTSLQWHRGKQSCRYVRAELHRHDGRKAWSQPVFVA
jgi:predicted metal-dependent phosphoesterase TrpH